jgi:hypothetical protein
VVDVGHGHHWYTLVGRSCGDAWCTVNERKARWCVMCTAVCEEGTKREEAEGLETICTSNQSSMGGAEE